MRGDAGKIPVVDSIDRDHLHRLTVGGQQFIGFLDLAEALRGLLGRNRPQMRVGVGVVCLDQLAVTRADLFGGGGGSRQTMSTLTRSGSNGNRSTG